MEEFWKQIDGYPNYSVSNLGMVKSVATGTPIILKQQPTKRRGVLLVRLGRGKTASVHRLVACAFVLNPENKPQVNHLDGNPKNNNSTNLEWATASENVHHAFETGLIKIESFSGERSAFGKLTKKQADDIRKRYASGLFSGISLAKEYGIHKTNIYRIIRGLSYKNFS